MSSNKLRVRRSFIFTPGLKPEMFPKAIESGADMVCIELEDGIARLRIRMMQEIIHLTL